MHQPSAPSKTLQNDTTHQSGKLLKSSELQANISADVPLEPACQCPKTIVGLLEDSESKAYQVEIRNIHTILAYQKQSLTHCNNMLDCTRCHFRSDHMMLLAVVCRKLVSMMEEVVCVFAEQSDLQIKRVGGDDRRHASSNLFFGDYVIDSEAERMPIIKTLIVVQLKSTLQILDRQRRIARTSSRETQVAILQAIEQKVAKMASNLQGAEDGVYTVN